MLSVLDFFIERSTFVLIVMAIAIGLSGVPRKRVRYRLLLAIGCVFTVGAAAEWYAHVVVAEKYFPGEALWYFFVLVALLLVAAILGVWELVTLRFFSRLKARDEKKG